jgi:thiamine-phosphate pyrophosphorylase
VLHSHHRFFLKYGLKGIHISERHKRKKINTWLKLLYYRYKSPQITVSTSFRNIHNINNSRNDYNYVFLNSTDDFLPARKNGGLLEGNNMSNILKKTKYPVVAIGGVRYDNIEQFYEMGFSGIGLKSALWDSADPVDSFIKIKQKCNEIEHKVKEELIHNAF